MLRHHPFTDDVGDEPSPRSHVWPLQAVTTLVDKMSAELGLRIYSFSVWHIFFEQYLSIAKDSIHILGEC